MVKQIMDKCVTCFSTSNKRHYFRNKAPANPCAESACSIVSSIIVVCIICGCNLRQFLFLADSDCLNLLLERDIAATIVKMMQDLPSHSLVQQVTNFFF